MKTEKVEKAEKTEFTVEQKFAIREAQFAILRARDLVTLKQEELNKLVQGIAQSLGLTEGGVNLDTLEITVK